MDAGLFTKMLSDKSVTDLKKLKYKYPQADLAEFVSLLKGSFYHALPLKDFDGGQMVYLESVAQVRLSAARVLLTPQDSSQPYGIKAMEEEIVSTLSIEQIDTSRDSVRKILSGYAPANESEKRIYAMKKGLEFIVDPAHQISEENLHQLYEMTIGVLLPEEDRLLPGNLYRNGSVYVVGDKVEHTGLSWKKLPEYMGALIGFANMDGDMNDLLKAALLHFDLAYLHPYFDGNGRMARLLHLWYLVQRGYSSALFVPLSGFIERSRKGYYDAYIENVYHKLSNALPAASTTEHFQAALASGGVTEKEKDLWQFVLSAYGGGEFSTKQLERDFGSAAYATIRSFVLKFEGMGLLHRTKYGNRVKYSVK